MINVAFFWLLFYYLFIILNYQEVFIEKWDYKKNNYLNNIYHDIKILINNSKNRIYTIVNKELLELYWNIGKIIVLHLPTKEELTKVLKSEIDSL